MDDVKRPHTPNESDVRIPEGQGNFCYEISCALEHYGGQSTDPLEKAAAEMKAAWWASNRIRRDVRALDERLMHLESHLRLASLRVRESLNNIEKTESIALPIIQSPSGLLTPAETAMKLGIGRAALTALARDDRFPKPIYVSPKKTAFIAAEIEKWIRGG